MAESDIDRINRLLKGHEHKNFVDRIYNVSKYPDLDLGNGMRATHKMAWGSNEDGAYVYPTVVQPKEGDPLIELGLDAGWDHAMATKNAVGPLSNEDADWLSQNYKQLWRK